jgi:histone deacetylase HOS3
MSDNLPILEVPADAGPSLSTIENHASTNALLLLSEQASSIRLQEQDGPDVGVILQSLCHLHRWTRTSNDLHIYERSDRLRSIRLGIAAAHGRLRAAFPHRSSVKGKEKATVDPPHDSLENLLENLTIKPNGNDSMVSSVLHEGYPFGVSTTTKRLSLLSQAVTLAHGADYASRLTRYLAGVTGAHASQKSEVPDDLSQGDLYLCEQSLSALEGALGACIQAVDEVCGPYNVEKGARRFVSVRPPGHHCESETPMGFCWLNNVAVAAAHGELSCPAFSYCF